MSGETRFEAKLAAARARVAGLRDRAGRATDAETRALLTEGLEELAVALEELGGARDELRAKSAAEADLRVADEHKDEFLAVLAHELRNPLAPIGMAAALLRTRAGLPEDAHRAAAVIDRQARRMGELVSDLLDISRIARGKLSVRPERLQLGEACRAAVEAIRPTAAGPELTVEVIAGPVWVSADPARLDQVLANLLTNAVKYTDAGGTVAVRVERDGNWAVIRIRDSGVGIEPAVLPHIFDLFIQAAHDRSQGGLGIGLHLVNRLVELQGGTVEARSDGPGRGSEFVVRLPAVTGG